MKAFFDCAFVAAVLCVVTAACSSSAPPAPLPGVVVLDSSVATGLMTLDLDTVPRCSDCIELTRLFGFGPEADPVLLRRLPSVVRDQAGRTIVVVSEHDHEMIVLDAAGRFDRVLGRYGRGPGEMQSIIAATSTPGDSLLVLHDGGFLTVFDPVFQPVQTVRLPVWAISRSVSLGAGRMVIAGRLRD